MQRVSIRESMLRGVTDERHFLRTRCHEFLIFIYHEFCPFKKSHSKKEEAIYIQERRTTKRKLGLFETILLANRLDLF